MQIVSSTHRNYSLHIYMYNVLPEITLAGKDDWYVLKDILQSNITHMIFFQAHQLLLPHINSLRPRDATWRHRSGSTLPQVMACCLTAPSHYLNQWNYEPMKSSVRSSGIHLRAISWEIPQPPFAKVSLKITYLKSNWNLPGASELTHWSLGDMVVILKV